MKMNTTTPTLNQLTFSWNVTPQAAEAPILKTPRPETRKSSATRFVPLGVPAEKLHLEDKVSPRRGRPEHISDLLLVVLDRYGIDPNEFLDGLE